jgi:hypothetical protein
MRNSRSLRHPAKSEIVEIDSNSDVDSDKRDELALAEKTLSPCKRPAHSTKLYDDVWAKALEYLRGLSRKYKGKKDKHEFFNLFKLGPIIAHDEDNKVFKVSWLKISYGKKWIILRNGGVINLIKSFNIEFKTDMWIESINIAYKSARSLVVTNVYIVAHNIHA